MRLEVDGRVKIALTALWTSGAILAAGTAVVAAHRDADGVAGYVGAAAALTLLAFFTSRGHPLATTVGFVICALQPFAVAATGWEITHSISRTQADKLRALGLDPTLGVAINLAFSACASVLAVCAYRTRRPRADRLGGAGAG